MSPLLCVLRLPRLEMILKVLQCPKQLTSPRFSIEIHRSKAFSRVILAILLTGPRRRMMRREYSPGLLRSEEYKSELQSLMRISSAVCCLKKKNFHAHTHNLQNKLNS